MENHTGPQQRGPDDQMHRTDQPTADRSTRTRGSTTGGDDRSGQGASDRRYVCLDCQSVVTDFPTECPHCGGRAFRTATTRRSSPTLYEQLLRILARVTAPLNPYVPR